MLLLCYFFVGFVLVLWIRFDSGIFSFWVSFCMVLIVGMWWLSFSREMKCIEILVCCVSVFCDRFCVRWWWCRMVVKVFIRGLMVWGVGLIDKGCVLDGLGRMLYCKCCEFKV